MSKKMITSGLALGLVAGSAGGLALNVAGNAGAAQTVTAAATTPSDDTTDRTTDDTTGGTTPGATDESTTTGESSTRPVRTARLREVLQPLIDAGTITQAQADAVIAALNDAGPIGGGGIGGGRRGGPGRHGGFGGPSLDVVATTIGISEDDLRSALREGQTIADVAAANGSSADAVIAALVAARTESIDAAVADGRLTQEQADDKLVELETKVTEMVNGTFARERGGRHGSDDSTDTTPDSTDATTGSTETTTGSTDTTAAGGS
jgi:hypothetical protein